MKLAGTVDLAEVLAALAHQRSLFHSEADFQHAFAWQVHCMDSNMTVRLETHPEPNVRLDLHFFRPDLGLHSAVELKYPTALWVGTVGCESYALKNHGASDIVGYDIVKDVHRVERFVAGRIGWNGAVVVLTNESSYWRAPTHRRATNADAFRIHQGVTLAGPRAWGPNTGNTLKGREAILDLRGSYPLAWSDYSRVDGRDGEFRSLVITVE